MNKRLIALLFAVLLCIAFIVPVSAEGTNPRVVDGADLLTETEEADLLSQLDEISLRQQFDVVVVTVDSLDGKTAQAYADDYYDYNGYGFGESFDGVLLLVSMEDRDWYISTRGYGITAFTDAGIEYIGEQIVSDLGSEFYYDAFNTYATLCDDFVTAAKNGAPYDVNNMPRGEFAFFFALLISLGIGAVVALIVCIVFMFQLKSVHSQPAAAEYEKKGSMKLYNSREFFLYRNVSREKRESESSGGSSTHTSSSGSTHGGGGGKF